MKLSSIASSCEKAERRLPEQTSLDTDEQKHGCSGTREASVENMLKNHCLAKSIADAHLADSQKVLVQGRDALKASILRGPMGNHSILPRLSRMGSKGSIERNHKCPKCGIKLPRDQNSAKLIRWLGIRKDCPPSDGGLSPAELSPLPSLRRMASISEEAGSLQIHS